MLRVALLILVVMPLACARLPDLEGSPEAQRAPYPDLLPFAAFFGTPTGAATEAVNLLAGTDARAASLRTRAAILRGSNDIEAIRARLAR